MPNKTLESFFTRTDEDLFVGNGPARGPWTADACHAGPVSGLLARSAENTITDKQMVRPSRITSVSIPNPPIGIGLAHATLFDEVSAVGIALQSLVLRPL